MARIQSSFLLSLLFFLIIVAGFISIYNYFLLDSSIERLRTSLKEVSQTKSFADLEAAGFLLQDLFVNELTDSGLSLERLIATEALEVATSPNRLDTSQPEAKFLLEDLLHGREMSRSEWIRTLDTTFQSVKIQWQKLKKYFDGLISKFTGVAPREEILERSARDILRHAREFELQWKFNDAALLYEKFLKNFPSYRNRKLVEINLAAVYLRARRFSDVRTLLSARTKDDSRLVDFIEKKMAEMEKLTNEHDQLERQALRSEAGPEKQTDSQTVLRLKERHGETEPVSALYFHMAILSLRLFDLDGSQQELEKALSLTKDPELEKKTTWLLGWIHLLRSDYAESKRLMSVLLQKLSNEKDISLATFSMAAISARSGEFSQAIDILNSLSKENATRETQFLLKYRTGSIFLYDHHDLTKALELFEEAEELAPNRFLSQSFRRVLTSVYTNSRELAFQELLQGNIKTARSMFESILSVKPDDAWSRCGHGVSLYLDGVREEGLKEAVTCRSIQKDPFTNSALAFLETKENDIEEAIVLYRDAVAERGDYIPALYNLGCLEMVTKDYASAAEHFLAAKKQAEYLRRYSPVYSNNLALAYLKLGEIQKAEVEFRTALEWEPNFPEALHNLNELTSKKVKADAAPQL